MSYIWRAIVEFIDIKEVTKHVSTPVCKAADLSYCSGAITKSIPTLDSLHKANIWGGLDVLIQNLDFSTNFPYVDQSRKNWCLQMLWKAIMMG